MIFNVIVTRDDDDEFIQMFFMDETFQPYPTPSIPLVDGYFNNTVTTKNFFIARIELIPNKKFKGKMETLADLCERNDFMFMDHECYQLKNKNVKDYTVFQSIKDQKFWKVVKQLAEKDSLAERFNESDEMIGEILNKSEREE